MNTDGIRLVRPRTVTGDGEGLVTHAGVVAPPRRPVVLHEANAEVLAELVEVVVMAVALDRAVEASEIVEALQPFGVTQEEVARVTHVSARAVRGWRESTIRSDRYDRLAELRDLVVLLSDSLTARGVSQWLRARNRLLDRERPIDVLVRGEFDRVREAAQAFVEGAYV